MFEDIIGADSLKKENKTKYSNFNDSDEDDEEYGHEELLIDDCVMEEDDV